MGLEVSIKRSKKIVDIYIFRHEGGIVAAKYDQPGYVHAMRLVVKDDM